MFDKNISVGDNVIKLPCSIGDTVYYVRFDKHDDGWITECIVCGIHITARYGRKDADNYLVVRIPPCMLSSHIEMKSIGITLFLSREDAEKKIKERKMYADADN